MVHGTVVQESPQRRGRDPTIQTLGDKSLDSAVLGQSWARAVLVRSWDNAVLGHGSWDGGLGTVVLGQ